LKRVIIRVAPIVTCCIIHFMFHIHFHWCGRSPSWICSCILEYSCLKYIVYYCF
jgi:hypothetical protein